MDGFEATKEIRRFNKDVIIIAQTIMLTCLKNVLKEVLTIISEPV